MFGLQFNLEGFARQGPKTVVKPEPSRMSFEVLEMNGGEIVEQIDTGIETAIVRVDNTYNYCIGYQTKITKKDVQLLCNAKAVVIEALSVSNLEITMNLFNQARAIARDALLGMSDPEKANFLSYFVAHDTVGYGPLGILIENKKNIEEIEVNSPKLPISVYTSRYGRCATNLRFTDSAAFRYNINKLISESEKELSEDSPIIDVQVDDARIHAQIKPYALSGAAASIRLGGEKNMDMKFLIKEGSLDTDTLAYLWLAIDGGSNIAITGAPASGKTTLLSIISGFIPQRNKVITIEEDINELHFNDSFANVIALYGEKYNITTKEQVLNALRLRPDRLVIGEIRGSEARDLFSGSNMGIPFITTMHSNEDPLGVVKRLIVKPMEVEVKSISMLDLSVYMLQTGVSKRRVNSIYEYRWLSRAEILKGTEVGTEDAVNITKVVENGSLAKSTLQTSKVIEHFAAKNGFSTKRSVQELEKRSKFLKDSISDHGLVPKLGELTARYCG